MNATLAHTLIALTILIGYTVLSALSIDGTALLALLGGQALGAGAQKLTEKKP